MISTRSALFTFRDEFGSKEQKGRSQRGVRGERSEIKTSPHRPNIRVRSCVESRWEQLCGVTLGAGSVWSLESAVGEELERAEETGARSAACHTVPSCGSLERGRRGVASQRHNGPR